MSHTRQAKLKAQRELKTHREAMKRLMQLTGGVSPELANLLTWAAYSELPAQKQAARNQRKKR